MRFQGIRTPRGCIVTVNGVGLDPRLDLRGHSPAGFEWGYHGSGPAQLALAILAAVTDDDDLAQAYYQAFKRSVVSKWQGDQWTLDAQDVLDWLAIRVHLVGGDDVLPDVIV